MVTAEKIRERLKVLTVVRGTSLRALAHKAGFREEMVYEYVNGPVKRFDVFKLGALCAELEVPMELLLNEDALDVGQWLSLALAYESPKLAGVVSPSDINNSWKCNNPGRIVPGFNIGGGDNATRKRAGVAKIGGEVEISERLSGCFGVGVQQSYVVDQGSSAIPKRKTAERCADSHVRGRLKGARGSTGADRRSGSKQPGAGGAERAAQNH